MVPTVDYHMHTPLCGHAVGEPQAYAAQARKLGLEEIGFSDHAPLVSHEDPKITMNFNQLPEYHRMIEDVQKKNPTLKIKIALEVDYLEGYEDQTKMIIQGYPYDYLIGSVHFIGKWGFDDPAEREAWKAKDINRVYHDYYDLLRKSAETHFFDIIGHADLPKKFGHRPTEDLTDEVEETAKVFQKCGVAIEINTAGLRKPVHEMYPAPDCLKIYQKAGVPLTFGSDAHDPNDVGRDFDQALALAKAVGYREYLVFKQRKVEKAIKL